MRRDQVISIVDDDESVRESTKNLVRSLGLKAMTFESAESFLDSGDLDDTVCLIADVQMPGMSGLQLQSQLIARGHQLPIILITAFPEASVRAQALAAGALGFLSKPFRDDSLIACIDEALAARGSS